MKLTKRIKPSSKAVLQAATSHEETQALLTILAMGEKELRAGKGIPMKKAFAQIRENANRRRLIGS
jgi:hypothetical protein